MLFKKWLGYKNHKALIVLGAGASRGASFVKTNQNPKPPLDNDFFSQIQFIKKGTNTKQIERLLDFVNKEFGSTIGVSMEEVFSQADYTSRFHEEVHVDKGPVVRRYIGALNCFYKSLPLLFQKAIRGNCEFHETLVEQMEAADVILSFNYDCLIDNALKEKADRKWKAKQGYGFEIDSGKQYWQKHGSSRGRAGKKGILLLKPHGSLNWKVKKKDRGGSIQVDLVKNLYDNRIKIEGSIIPPVWFKEYGYPFNEVLKKARKEIRNCLAVVVIGYSLPPTDIFSQALFKTEIGSAKKLKLVILVNPDRDARIRFIKTIHHGLDSGTRVIEFSSLEELKEHILH